MSSISLKMKVSKNRDILVSIIVALVLISISIPLGIIDSYSKLGIDSIIIEVFGTLLGLAITSLGIVMTLLPHLDIKLLGSDTFDDVINHFIYMIVSEVAIIIIGLIIYAFYLQPTSLIKAVLIVSQLFLSFLSAIMIIYATLYLYYLFKVIKKQRLEKG